MANNHTAFSEALRVTTEAQHAWLTEEIERRTAWVDDPDHEDDALDCEVEFIEPGVVFSNDEGGCNIDGVCELVRDFLRQFEINEPWTIAWADYCDRSRISEFGGGAAVVWSQRIEYMNTMQWLERTVTAGPYVVEARFTRADVAGIFSVDTAEADAFLRENGNQFLEHLVGAGNDIMATLGLATGLRPRGL